MIVKYDEWLKTHRPGDETNGDILECSYGQNCGYADGKVYINGSEWPSRMIYSFDDIDDEIYYYHSTGQRITINSAGGDDKIHINGGYNLEINLGTGNDSIFDPTGGGKLTISGGPGNDTINIDPINGRGDGNVVIYRAGDGNDVIPSAGAGFDTLKIYGNYSIDRNVIRVGSGSITFVDGISRSLVIDAIAGHMKYNGSERNLDYLKQAMTEQVKTNFQGSLDYFNTDPTMQSILKYGKDSPYLAEVSPEIAEQIANSYRESYDMAKNLKSLNDKEIFLSNINDILGKINNADYWVSFLDNVGKSIKIMGKKVGSIEPHLALLLSVSDFAIKGNLLSTMKAEFKAKYPDVDIDATLKR